MNPKQNGSSVPAPYEALPGFRDVPNSEKKNLFIRKLNLCCVVFDFIDPTKNLKEKDIKRQTLLELVDYVTSANGKFTETVTQEAIKMVSVNLFRPLTPHSQGVYQCTTSNYHTPLHSSWRKTASLLILL